MTAFRFAGGSSLVRSSASAASRAATSRSPFFAWNNSLVMSSAARIAALCVSTMGPCDNTFFSAWSTYAATSRVYSGGRSDRTVYSSPPIITLTACFLVLTGPLRRHPARSSATWRRMVSSWSSTCASALSPSYAKLTLQRHQPPRQQRIHVPLAQRPLGVAERAVPSHAAVPRRDAGPPILVEHFEPLEQRPYRPPQDIRDLGGGDVRGQHQRQVPLDRGLQWQRAVCHQVALPRVQPYLETEQWSGPNRRICLEGAGPTHHAATALHRLPTHRPTRCRFQVTARGGDAHS